MQILIHFSSLYNKTYITELIFLHFHDTEGGQVKCLTHSPRVFLDPRTMLITECFQILVFYMKGL